MEAHKKSGLIIGILFITGTASAIISFVFTGALDNSHEYLEKIATGEKQFILGALFVLIMGLSLAFIPIILYPVLSKYNKSLAIGYVVFRSGIETIIFIAIWVSMLLLLYMGKTQANSNIDVLQLNNITGMILHLRELGSLVSIFFFGVGAFLFYTVLFQSKLVPVWLSIWGIIAILFHMVSGFLIMFGLQTEASLSHSYLSFPIFLQEIGMAIWLIVKGFNPRHFNVSRSSSVN